MIHRLEHAGIFLTVIAGLGAVGAFLVWLRPDRALTVGRHARTAQPQRQRHAEGGEVR